MAGVDDAARAGELLKARGGAVIPGPPAGDRVFGLQGPQPFRDLRDDGGTVVGVCGGDGPCLFVQMPSAGRQVTGADRDDRALGPATTVTLGGTRHRSA